MFLEEFPSIKIDKNDTNIKIFTNFKGKIIDEFIRHQTFAKVDM